ncbi:hypothetical protein SASPL_106102 [Salvia splendens]|uniref:GUN4-like domain-containing protein n=1 Tax=Salvia splendens TaxID=180675 RepID=A0A8X8YQU7_SALSN|nr:hypothetical protein SASPL_106102 [Salvia splendens]
MWITNIALLVLLVSLHSSNARVISVANNHPLAKEFLIKGNDEKLINRDLGEKSVGESVENSVSKRSFRIPQKKRGEDVAEVQFIPPEALRKIDALWWQHNDGKFGYSVQRRIWKKLNGDFTVFFIKVGWMKKLESSEVEQYNYRELSYGVYVGDGGGAAGGASSADECAERDAAAQLHSQPPGF